MARYTITICSLVENNFDFELNEYPIFNEEYRSVLNNKILNHYYMSEIGFETPALFRFYLKQKLNEIMPYYNILYNKQNSLLTNLEHNVNLTEDFKRKSNTNTNTNSNSKSDSTSSNLFQDTPQGKINLNDFETDTYATNYNKSKSNVNDNSISNGNANSTEDYIKLISGNNGSKYNYEILDEIKNKILNIDVMIINELNDLFMGLIL